MSAQDSERQYVYVPLQETSIARIAFTIILMIALGFSGLLSMMFAGWTRNDPVQRALANPFTSISTPNPGVHLTPTPEMVPSPSPAAALPPVLSQAKAALRAQNKLLYYGNRSLPEIALTFDDGPNTYYTPQILAILQRYHINATFFCIGRLVADYPALVRQEYATGNIIGNHSWSHPQMNLLSPAAIQLQISKTSYVIEATIGVRPTFFRPPYGLMSVAELTQLYHDGMTTVIWNDEGQDWTRPGVSIIIQRIVSLAHNGAIILMHDGGGDRSQTVAALPTIIQNLEQRGFQFVTMQQMAMDLQRHQSTTDGGRTPGSSPLPSLLVAVWRREPASQDSSSLT
jgi:peptidoglycan/xylan/chitin deacetylase (PgdA/CDA1 family)